MAISGVSGMPHPSSHALALAHTLPRLVYLTCVPRRKITLKLLAEVWTTRSLMRVPRAGGLALSVRR